MSDSAVVILGLLSIAAVIAGGVGWLWRSASYRKAQGPKSTPRPRMHRHRPYAGDDEPYESPLGFVDTPEDEWIEYAIMDEMFNGD